MTSPSSVQDEKISEFIMKIMLNEYKNNLDFAKGWDRNDIVESWIKVMDFTANEIFEIIENNLFGGFAKHYDEQFSVNGMVSLSDWCRVKNQIKEEIKQ